MKRPKKFRIKKEKSAVAPTVSPTKQINHIRKTGPKVIKPKHSGCFVFLKKKFSRLKEIAQGRFFPLISRLITAPVVKYGLVIVVIMLISCYFVVNIFFSSSPFGNLKEHVLINYKNADFHLLLAKELLKNNDLIKARQELLVGLSISPKNKDLTEQLNLVEALINKPSSISAEINKWEKIVSEKPNFRDGYFRLAILYYQFFNLDAAKKYVLKALELDPNFEPAKQFLRMIS